MGLGAPRKRTKLARDPNNTQWSRSTDGYGHKLLLSQGWIPGSYLGAMNAPHAHLHTNANASHIRVALKDGNLGLGAKRGSGIAPGECTGLDVFQGLLGRLNGKSDAVLAKEQKSRDELKQAAYSERKFGNLRFVSGGILVGDQIQKLSEQERLRVAKEPPSPLNEQHMRVLGSEEHAIDSAEPDVKVTETEPVDPDRASPMCLDDSGPIREEDKGKRKLEKALLKAERRERKEARRAARLRSESEVVPSPTNLSLEQEESADVQTEVIMSQSCLATALTVPSSGRHTVRERYIRQKKLALLDPKALNEILMVKS